MMDALVPVMTSVYDPSLKKLTSVSHPLKKPNKEITFIPTLTPIKSKDPLDLWYSQDYINFQRTGYF